MTTQALAKTVGILALLLTVVLRPSLLPDLRVHAQPVHASDRDLLNALWVAGTEGIVKIDTANGTVLFEISDLEEVRALAVDAERETVWALSQHTLRAYSLQGELVISVPLSAPDGDDEHLALAVDPRDGSVWLGVHKTVFHYDAHGGPLHASGLSDNVQALTIDRTAGRLWVATKKSVTAYDQAGQVGVVLNLGKSPDITSIALDAGSGDVWVALKNALRRYAGDGTLRFQMASDTLEQVASDGKGGVWMATKKAVRRLAPSSGTMAITVSLEPFSGKDEIVTLAVDPSGGSVWVADHQALRHVGPDGRIIQSVDFDGSEPDLRFEGTIQALALSIDLIPPTLSFTAPSDGIQINTGTPAIELTYEDVGSGIDTTTLRIQAGGQDLGVKCVVGESAARCSPPSPLPEGLITLTATIADHVGNPSQPATVSFTVDTVPPAIVLDSPQDGTLTNHTRLTFLGRLSEQASLTLNGETVSVGSDHEFSHDPPPLQEGLNLFTLVATDLAGNRIGVSIRVTLDTRPPAPLDPRRILVISGTDGQVRVTGTRGSVEAGASVTVTNNRTGQTVTLLSGTDGSFSALIPAQNGDVLSIVTIDLAGNTSEASTISVGGSLPPDPMAVAPPLDRTVVTDFASATAFLYAGAYPIQTGVATHAIEPRRAAVLRGQVRMRNGSPLPGVTLTVRGHMEYGQTRSRADGMFDIAVNGGSTLTVRYEKKGFLPVDRQVRVPWQGYSWLPEVVMLAYDPQVTAIDLTASSGLQVARGSVIADADGSRQATLLFAPGTQAQMLLPDGTTQGLTALHVRATEYSVGASGPAAMPAGLPPTSAYTYAVEFSVDEAVAAGAPLLQFTQPVVFYLENFLNFPEGESVPVGYYDRGRGLWVPSSNGQVLKILSLTGGMVELDTNGDGAPDSPAILSALGITDAERQRLATLYQPGQRLWRVPVSHFSAWDCNWGWGPPADAGPPAQVEPAPQGGEPLDDPECQAGSIIQCQNQALGEVLPITGTPFKLHYQSDRVSGRQTSGTFTVSLSGPSVPASLRRIDLVIEVAGQRFAQSFPPDPNQRTSFTWNGNDGYERLLQGAQRIDVQIGYVYGGTYGRVARFGYRGNGTVITGSPTRREVTLWQEWVGTIGAWDAGGQNLVGWSLDISHLYDPIGRVLYLGDGRRRSVQGIGQTITTVAGTGILGASGDGGPATLAQLYLPYSVAAAPDGSLYIADTLNNRIRHVSPDGTITTVAGNGSDGYGGDGGPATQAQLSFPTGVAVGPDGSLYIADLLNSLIRRVGSDGVITTVAGTGFYAYGGDGGPAVNAHLKLPTGVAVAGDGSLYIADYLNDRIRRVAPDGVITTVAGTGIGDFSGDGGPASQARLRGPWGVVVGPEGNLYIVDTNNNRIRRVGPEGVITTVAGNGMFGYSGDGGPATQARLDFPFGLIVGPDGSLYIADFDNNRIRRVSPDGVISTVVGSGRAGYSGDGGLATQAQLNSPAAVAMGPDGALYIVDRYNSRIRRVDHALPGYSSTDTLIPSEDGSEIYVFSDSGRHLRTLDALTGSVRYRFTYDPGKGYVTAVTDGDGNVTTIEFDASGHLLGIVGPFGHRTTLEVDANGYLASVTNPAGETTLLTYTSDGLLTSLTDAKGSVHQFAYDSLGRLVRDDDPAGGFTVLGRTDSTNGRTVSLTSALNRINTYLVERLSTGDTHRVNTAPSGLQTVTQIGTDGTRTTAFPSGLRSTVVQGPDPRFGMQAPVSKSLQVITPGGLAFNMTQARTISLSDPLDLLSLTGMVNTVTVNGRIFTSTFDAGQRTMLEHTPAGREFATTLDAQGHVVEAQVAGLDPTRLTYDVRGRLVTVAQGTRTAGLTYDAQGNLASVTDPMGRLTSFGYDPIGRLTEQTLPDGRVVLYTYDANGNVTSVTPPGRPSHAFTYTPIDFEEAYIAPDVGAQSNPTLYAYNLDRQLVQVSRPDSSTVTLEYDGAGRLSRLELPHGEVSYAYDPASGYLASMTAPDGGRLTYQYDGGLPTETLWSGTIAGSVHRTYDNNFRLTSESVNGGFATAFQYDLDGLLAGAGALSISRDPRHGFITGTTLAGISDARTYNSVGELDSYHVTLSGGEIFATQFVRDDLGRITQKTETVNGQTDTYAYTYDLAGRLTEVQQNGIPIATYIYDSNGNRLRYSGLGGTASGTYDAQDRLLQYGATTYAYTANGDLLTKTTGSQTTSYTYDALGNLLAVGLPDGTQLEYVIDGSNRRIGKKVNGALIQGFLYKDGLLAIAELDGSGHVRARFIYATKPNVPDYMEKDGVIYRLISDHLGSPRLVIDTGSGAVVQRIVYDAFGNVLLDTNPGFQPFGFAGGLYDQHTQLTRFGARDYDAAIGRWTAKDPILFEGSDGNLYGYVLNDPVNWIDPLGLFSYSPRAGRPVDTTTEAALTCFEGCVGGEVIITGAREDGHRPGSAHGTGQACDIGKSSNPSLSRTDAERCFRQCFDQSRSYGQEERDHFHFQTRPGHRGATGFAPGVR